MAPEGPLSVSPDSTLSVSSRLSSDSSESGVRLDLEPGPESVPDLIPDNTTAPAPETAYSSSRSDSSFSFSDTDSSGSMGSRTLVDNFPESSFAERISEPALRRIFHFLPWKADQRTLTLLDRSTYELLFRKLYHSVVIDLAAYPDNLIPVSNMLNKRNAGRRKIRRIEFDASRVRPGVSPPAGFDGLAHMVLRGVHFDQLEYFGWPENFQLHPAYTVRLWELQARLQNMFVYNDTLSTRKHRIESILNQLNAVTSLRVSPTSEIGLRFVYQIFERCPIEELHLDLRNYEPFFKNGGRTAGTGDQRGGTIFDGVTNLLFAHVTPLSKCSFRQQLPLKKLVLWNVDLKHSAKTWHKIIRRGCLEELELCYCRSVAEFLDRLAALHPSIKALKIEGQPEDAGECAAYGLELDEALIYFLHDLKKLLKVGKRSSDDATKDGNATSRETDDDEAAEEICGLEELQLEIPTCSNELLWAISRHSSTLKVFRIDACSFPDDETGPRDDAIQIIEDSDTDDLLQLGIDLSTVSSTVDAKIAFNPATLLLINSSNWSESPQEIADWALWELNKSNNEQERLRVIAVRQGRTMGIENEDVPDKIFMSCKYIDDEDGIEYVEMRPVPNITAKFFAEEAHLDILRRKPARLGDPDGFF